MSNIATSVVKKLTRRESNEWFLAILTGIITFICIMAAIELSGWLAAGMWVVASLQILNIILKMFGWRTVTLSNQEQEFLSKNLDIREK